MKTIFDNPEYVTKQLLSLISDEGKRIVSASLATGDDLRRVIEPVIKLAVNRSTANANILINTLGLLHDILSDVKLPNDFGDASDSVSKVVLVLNPDDSISNVLNKDEKQEEEDKKIEEKVEENEENEDKVDEQEEQDCIEFKNNARLAVKKLEKLASDFGRQGEHERAYIIEKALREIDKLIE